MSLEARGFSLKPPFSAAYNVPVNLLASYPGSLPCTHTIEWTTEWTKIINYCVRGGGTWVWAMKLLPRSSSTSYNLSGLDITMTFIAYNTVAEASMTAGKAAHVLILSCCNYPTLIYRPLSSVDADIGLSDSPFRSHR